MVKVFVLKEFSNKSFALYGVFSTKNEAEDYKETITTPFNLSVQEFELDKFYEGGI